MNPRKAQIRASDWLGAMALDEVVPAERYAVPMLVSKRMEHRPLPQGYTLHVERAPLCLPPDAARSLRRPRHDAYRSTAPLVVIQPPVVIVDRDPEPRQILAAHRAEARRSALVSLAYVAAVLAVALLALFLRR